MPSEYLVMTKDSKFHISFTVVPPLLANQCLVATTGCFSLLGLAKHFS